MQDDIRKNQAQLLNRCLVFAIVVPVLVASVAVYANPVLIRKQMGEAGQQFAPVPPPPPSDLTVPTLLSSNPADDAVDVALDVNLVLNFSEAVQAGSGTIEIRTSSPDALVESIPASDTGRVSFGGNQVTVNPATALAGSTGYLIRISGTAIRDAAANNYAGISDSASLNFVTRAVDPFFSQVELLLKCDGSDGGAITDSSGHGRSPSVIGNPAISTAQSRYGSGSCAFSPYSGGVDYLGFADSGFNFGTGDFTVEGWIRVPNPTVSAYSNFISVGDSGNGYASGGWLVTWYPNADYDFAWATSPANWTAIGNDPGLGVIASGAWNTWNHYAITRDSGTLRVFINGVQRASVADSNNYTSADPVLWLGGRNTSFGYYSFEGWVDDFRVTRGAARYTSNFTPPDALPVTGP